tara:strand:- start:4960 stop:7191 length:2232 start_codon:yes stop_codon:yes gene_type:complete
MTVKFTNDARTALASGITASSTSLTVVSTVKFPTLASGDYTYLTLSNATDTAKEIVKCTAISGTTLTVIRGQESTTALAFNIGEHVQLRITAGLFGDALDEKVDDSQVLTNVPVSAIFTDTITTSASDLTSGTLPDDRFPAILPAISGANLTDLPAAGGTAEFVASGTLPNGSPVVLQSDGTVKVVSSTGGALAPVAESIPAGSASLFSPVEVISIQVAFDSTNANKFVVIYQDIPNNVDGTAVVGTLSGTTISFGTPVVYSQSGYSAKIAFDPNTAGKFVIAEMDLSNSYYGTAIVGTISGTSATFGTPVVFNSLAGGNHGVSFDPNTAGKFVIAYQQGVSSSANSAVVVGTLSGTTATFGTPVVYNSTTGTTSVSFDPNTAGKFVLSYADKNNLNTGTVRAGTLSGTTITLGTAATLSGVVYGTGLEVVMAFDPNTASKFVVAYGNSSNSNYGTAVVGTLSGTAISFGTAVVFNTATTTTPVISFDPTTANKFVVVYKDGGNSDYATAIVGTVAGTSVSFGSASVLTTSSSSYIGVAFGPYSSGRFVFTYRDSSNLHVGTIKVGQIATMVGVPNLTATNFLGISTAAYTNTQIATIMLQGGVATNQTGLVLDSTYYVQSDGTLATTVSTPSVEAGKALSATSLFLSDSTASVTSIDGLTDVDTSTSAPTARQVLTWDNSSSLWNPEDSVSYKSETISTSKVLDADTQYLTGKNLVIAHGVVLTIPSSSQLITKLWAAQKQL